MGGECSVPVVHRFPQPPPNGNGIFWYSFDQTNVHFVMLSSEHNFTDGSAQLEWLTNDLRKVDRRATPWIVVTLHRPMYCSNAAAVGPWAAKYLDPVLTQYRVNLVFAGHNHLYERTCPVVGRLPTLPGFGGHCQDGAPVHVTVGSAGPKLGGFTKQKPSWSMKQLRTWGFCNIRVNGAESMIMD